MSNTRAYSIREKALDRCLKSGQWFSGKQLMEAVNHDLDEAGELPITSRTTLQADLTSIANKLRTDIEMKREGRIIYYKYPKSNISIYSPELSEQDLNHLREALQVLARFEGLPQFDWIEELRAHLNISFQSQPRPMVAFEESLYKEGMKHFAPLFEAIQHRTALKITYKSFKMRKPDHYYVSPYYLKQYNNRWYLICQREGFHTLTNLALDRIKGIANSGKSFQPSDIDFEEYFEDVIGVSIINQPPEEVEIWFDRDQLNYVKTKPLHGSQKLKELDDGTGIVKLNVIINYELEQKILSFGEKAKVLYPLDFQQKIKERIIKSVNNY